MRNVFVPTTGTLCPHRHPFIRDPWSLVKVYSTTPSVRVLVAWQAWHVATPAPREKLAGGTWRRKSNQIAWALSLRHSVEGLRSIAQCCPAPRVGRRQWSLFMTDRTHACRRLVHRPGRDGVTDLPVCLVAM